MRRSFLRGLVLNAAGLLALALAADFLLGRAAPAVGTAAGAAIRVGLPALALLGAGVAVLRIRDRLPRDEGSGGGPGTGAA